MNPPYSVVLWVVLSWLRTNAGAAGVVVVRKSFRGSYRKGSNSQGHLASPVLTPVIQCLTRKRSDPYPTANPPKL